MSVIIRYLQLLLTLVCLSGLFLSTSTIAATEEEIAEYNIKAAFLYKFASYVEWPGNAFSDSDSSIVFGIMESDILAGTLEQIVSNRNLKGRAVEVRRLSASDNLSGVHVLFVGRLFNPDLDDNPLNATVTSVLTVTENANERPLGSVINFETIADKVRFDVSLVNAEQADLRISSRLLQVAYRVIGDSM